MFEGGRAEQARALGITGSITTLPYFSPRSPEDRATLAAIYRRASLVLQPSEAEGLGLPLAEAMACGTPLLVSEIPVLREVAGDAAVYAPVADVPAWIAATLRILVEVSESSEAWRRRQALGLERARLFRWPAHVDQVVAIYRDLHARVVARSSRS